jgi:predicted acylesterase/phospholipase RssA
MGPAPAEVKAVTPKAQIKTANLALQGAGAHGAFTWGVLDRLLESRDSRSMASARRAPAR